MASCGTTPRSGTIIAKTVHRGGLPALLRAEFVLAMPTGYYRPVALFSLWLDGRLAPIFPAAYHATNVALHALNAGLAFAVLARWLSSPAAAALGSFLFAVHPVHAESVAFVSGRTDLLACAFVLIAGLAVWHSQDLGGGKLAAGVGALAYGLACLSKEVAVPLPAILLAFEAIRLKDRGGGFQSYWNRNRNWLLGFAAALSAVLYLRIGVAGIGLAARYGGFSEAARGSSFDLIPRGWSTYARLLVIPWSLHSWYRAEDLKLTAASLGSAAALVFALGWTATAAHRRTGLHAAAWIFGFAALVSGLAPVSTGMAVIAERFLYLPSLGFCGLVGHLVSSGLEKPRIGRIVAVAAAGAILLLALGTAVRNRSWESNLTVFREALRATPDSWVIRGNYGAALAERGFHKEAVVEYRRTLERRPDYATVHGNLARSLAALGEKEAAIAHYREAVRLKPDWFEARINLGLLLFDARRWGEAAEQYRAVLSSDPTQVLARMNLGNALSEMGKNEEALAEYRVAQAIEPGNPMVAFNLGVTLAAMGRWLEAAAAYRTAISFRPDYPEARHNLAALPAGAGAPAALPPLPASLAPRP